MNYILKQLIPRRYVGIIEEHKLALWAEKFSTYATPKSLYFQQMYVQLFHTF